MIFRGGLRGGYTTAIFERAVSRSRTVEPTFVLAGTPHGQGFAFDAVNARRSNEAFIADMHGHKQLWRSGPDELTPVEAGADVGVIHDEVVDLDDDAAMALGYAWLAAQP